MEVLGRRKGMYVEQTPGILNFYLTSRRRLPSDMISWWSLNLHLGEEDVVGVVEMRGNLRQVRGDHPYTISNREVTGFCNRYNDGDELSSVRTSLRVSHHMKSTANSSIKTVKHAERSFLTKGETKFSHRNSATPKA